MYLTENCHRQLTFDSQLYLVILVIFQWDLGTVKFPRFFLTKKENLKHWNTKIPTSWNSCQLQKKYN
jgi:hypothetical protein